MAKVTGTVVVDTERCKGCDLCVVACPADVLALARKDVNDRGYHFAMMVNADACVGCAACATVCPDGCIEVYRVVEK
ncbi:MAG: 4Fe-4S binding protein [Muribaculaceae bacterium]|nr:4Fe-4S binding protein [Muribaculaceae bacterium]